MTGAAYTFLGIVWVAILGTAGIALKKIVEHNNDTLK
mgnify:CR=1 FL=1